MLGVAEPVRSDDPSFNLLGSTPSEPVSNVDAGVVPAPAPAPPLVLD